MINYKIKFKNGRTTTICCDSNEEIKSDLVDLTKRFNSEIATINDMPTEKLSVGGFLLGTFLGGILGNSVAKSGVKKTAKTITKSTKKTIYKAKKGVDEFRSASKRKSQDDIFQANEVRSSRKRKSKDPDDIFQKNEKYAKGGNIATITRKVNEVNRLIALGNENNISVIDSSGTWEAPMKYKPIKYSNGTLYIEYQELDLYKNNRTGVKDWVTVKEKVLKRNMEYDSPLNDIAKWYRKALKNANIMFEDGGMSSMALAGASPQLAIGNEISKRLPATTSAIDKKFAERIYSEKPSMWEDRGLKHYGKGGVLNEYEEEQFKIWKSDGNVSKNADGTYSTQDAQWSNKIKNITELKKYFKKEFFSDSYYAKGGSIGQEITFKHWSGDTKNGTITEDLGNGNFQVSSGFGNVLVNQEDIISSGIKSPERKKMFGFFNDGGGVWQKPYYYDFWIKEMLPYFVKELKNILSKTKDEYLKGIYLNDISFTIGHSGNFIFEFKSEYNYDLTMKVIIDVHLKVKDSNVLHEIKEWEYSFDDIEQVGGFEGDKPVFKAIEKLCLETSKKYATQIYALKSKKYSGGGSTNEGIDLFEDYTNIPPKVQKILDKYADTFEYGDYKDLAKAQVELKRIGYTFDFGLDGQAYDLRPIGTKGKVEE